jgi:hypothetical protein
VVAPAFSAAWCDVPAQPGRKCGFFDLAGSDGEHDLHAIVIAGQQAMAVEFYEQFCANEGSALVAVDKRVVARHTITIRSRTVRNIWRAIGHKILWTSQRGMQQTGIAHTRRTAMLG